MSDQNFDMIVIGAGPGGYVAAIRGAQLGLNVACIEREHLGGICLNWGCIPTKAMLRSAEVLNLVQRAKDFGVKVNAPTPDLEAIVKRSRAVAKQLSNGVGYLFRKNKVTSIMGQARLVGTGKVVVTTDDEEQVLHSANIIVATGARARQLPGLESDGKRVWTYKHALQPPHEPKKLLVIGSGAIGIEFASFYNGIGADVTVVEVMERLLPVEDAEIAAFAKKAFERRGMTIREGAKVARLDRHDDKVVVHIETPDSTTEEEFDTVISAVGIVGNVEGLGLSEAGVKVDRSHIVTDPYCRTGVEGLYAVGDVVAGPWLAHKASHEGVMVAEMIAGRDGHPVKPETIAGCTYCHPQIASVGLTEAQAKAAGYDVRVGRFPFQANGKAIALGDSQGLIKTVFDAQTDALLGAHMVGAEVTELIQGYVIGQKLETTGQDLMETVFPHPTLSEMMHESALDANDRVIHY
ncbi:dihydrolipoyl dehydrogenase [uncultured Roseobacter sp.]|uniref:dihydrolipoyl dehydrogenase n=1 Tax=uncultured Roseobacter sp. TaxID=114847 RepID=UPI0026163778|nr:dihydrolipoyl dehydrogenase [uncultured Roseobacter sp.]